MSHKEYVFHEFPKWIHHHEHGSKVVHSAEEQEAHEGWHEALPATDAVDAPAADKPKRGRKPKPAEPTESAE